MRADIQTKILNSCNSKLVNLDGLEIIDTEIGEVIDCIIKSIPDIEVISLDNNLLKNTGAEVLFSKLADIYSLEQLSVQSNQIGREGAVKLFSLKNTLPELQIAFYGNLITNASEMHKIEVEATTQTNKFTR